MVCFLLIKQAPKDISIKTAGRLKTQGIQIHVARLYLVNKDPFSGLAWFSLAVLLHSCPNPIKLAKPDGQLLWIAKLIEISGFAWFPPFGEGGDLIPLSVDSKSYLEKKGTVSKLKRILVLYLWPHFLPPRKENHFTFQKYDYGC